MRKSLLSHLARFWAAVNVTGLDYRRSLIIVQRKRPQKRALSSSHTAMSFKNSNQNTVLLLLNGETNAIIALTFIDSSERVVGKWYTFHVSNVVNTFMQKPERLCIALMRVAKKRIGNASAL